MPAAAFVNPRVKLDYSALPLDRLVAKETALGTIRQAPIYDRNHIGVAQIAPMEDVESDDVIFDFIDDQLQEGLAPARAQDAESQLAQKDFGGVTTGRARIIDWSQKSTYDSSKVMSYRNNLRALQELQGLNSVVLQAGGNFDSPVRQFQATVAQDDAWRRQRLDDRLEHLIITSLETGKYAYDDGKIAFAVDYKRPAGQQDVPVTTVWDNTAADPIGDILAMNRVMYDTYGFELRRAYCSKYILRDLFKLDKFQFAATGLLINNQPAGVQTVTPYINPGWNAQKAIDIIEQATGVTFIPYDAVYRTRPLGQPASAAVNVRYMSSKKVIFLPTEDDLRLVDLNGMGFAKTLTSPHAEGNWTPGFYEWEQERRDPWTVDRGNGIKAFPIFPFMKYSYVMKVKN